MLPLLRSLLCSSAVAKIDALPQYRGKLWLEVVRALLTRSKAIGLPRWLKGFYTGTYCRSVFVECRSETGDASLVEVVRQRLQRFGALECPPLVVVGSGGAGQVEGEDEIVSSASLRRFSRRVGSSYPGSESSTVLVTFKSPIAARAAIANARDEVVVSVRSTRRGDTNSTSSAFADSRSDPARLIRLLLDAGLVHEACDVAIFSFESVEEETKRAIPSQPLWLPERLLGEVLWRARLACSDVHGTLRKFGDTGYTPRLCVAWQPSGSDGDFVLEIAPHMGGVRRISLKGATFRKTDPYHFELSVGHTTHRFEVSDAKGMTMWEGALGTMTRIGKGSPPEPDALGRARSALRGRISRLRALLESTIEKERGREHRRRVDREVGGGLDAYAF